MARIKFGALVSEISGSIGSATFQKSNFGNTLRTKPRSRRSGTTSQMSCRYIMMQLHQAWAALTDAQRQQWNRFVSFSGAGINRDKAILLTGHSLFIKYNFLRLLNHQAILTVPAYVVMPPFPQPGGLFIDGADYNFWTLYNVDISTFWYVLKLTIPRKHSLSFSPAGLRFMYITPITASAWLFGPPYLAAFGHLPAVGDYIHYSVQFYSMTSPVISQIQKGVFVVATP
jgi:hypothetical protein